MTKYVPVFSIHLRFPDVEKIILRARQQHLFDNFRTQTTSLTPDLLAKVQAAWQSHVLDKVSKGLPDKIKPTVEALHTLWPQIEALRDDRVQKAECLKRDEKFEMNLGAAVGSFPLYANNHFDHVPQIRTASALSAARQGQRDRESALTLLDESRDILAASLDKEVMIFQSDRYRNLLVCVVERYGVRSVYFSCASCFLGGPVFQGYGSSTGS